MAYFHRLAALAIAVVVVNTAWAIFPTAAMAAAPIQTYLNGQELRFDVAPALESGRLLVPVRGYLEAMGARLDWDSANRRVTATTPDHRVAMTIGQPQALVDGAPVTLEIGPVIVNGRTLIPLRFLSEAVGAQVAYDAVARRVDVKYSRPAPPSRSGADSGRQPTKPAAGSATRQVLVVDGPLNLRAGPGTNQPVLGVLPSGTVLQLVTDGADWLQVQLTDGRSGWVARAYVAIMDTPPSATGLAAKLVALGTGLVGSPYVWGGETPAGFDCSGFLKYIFGQAGITLPRSTSAQAEVGTAVAGDLRPGDILVYTTYAPGPTHTALYIGSGKMVHAKNETDGVTITELSNPYWAARYLGARRVLPDR